tara:strand:- start:2841 stop:4349 length:1509 start_codon:yes stop_codon:yes gene_type:complete
MKIGTAYTITPGSYSAQGGGTVNTVTKWIVGGFDKANPYTPAPADDFQNMTLDEVSTETGGTAPGNTATSISAGTVTYEAPVAGTPLVDQSFAEDTGGEQYDTSSGVSGVVITYEINELTGVSIDAGQGIVYFNTDIMPIQTNTPMTVTYSNSGGSTGMPFNLDITAAVIDAPIITNLIADPSGDIDFTTDTGEGTAYVVFGDTASPSAASVVAGTGDVAANFAVTGSGGQSAPIDLTSIAGLTKYCSVVQVDSLGAQSNVLTTSVDVAVAGYVQKMVDTNGNSRLQTFGGPSDSATLTFAMTLEQASFVFSALQANRGTNGVNINTVNSSAIRVSVWDSNNLLCYVGETAQNTILNGVRKTLYVSIDLSGALPVVDLKMDDGSELVSVTLTPSTSIANSGLINTGHDTQFLALNNNSNAFDGLVGDIFFQGGVILDPTLFYTNGEPQDLTGVGNPFARFGGDMTADERNGNTSEGWNDAFNLGTGSMNAADPLIQNFTDEP